MALHGDFIATYTPKMFTYMGPLKVRNEHTVALMYTSVPHILAVAH